MKKRTPIKWNKESRQMLFDMPSKEVQKKLKIGPNAVKCQKQHIKRQTRELSERVGKAVSVKDWIAVYGGE